MHPTTVLEIIQLILNCLALAYGLYAARQTLAVYKYIQLQKIGNGRRVVAFSHVRAEVLRLAVQFLLFAMAINAYFMPPPPLVMPEAISDLIIVRKLILSIVAALLMLQTYCDAVDRSILAQMHSDEKVANKRKTRRRVSAIE